MRSWSHLVMMRLMNNFSAARICLFVFFLFHILCLVVTAITFSLILFFLLLSSIISSGGSSCVGYATQQTRYIGQIMVQCWVSVKGSTLGSLGSMCLVKFR